MSTKKEDKKLKRKEEIMQGALELFASKGFYNTTIPDIANALKMSAGNMYNYFKSKDILAKEIISFISKYLGNELKKINRICNKAHASSPHRTILILDGTQGNSAIAQAKAFNEMVGIDGIIITKLDGTAKGGSVLSIAHELQIPIYYIGTGEQPDDLIEFKANEYVNTILDEIFI